MNEGVSVYLVFILIAVIGISGILRTQVDRYLSRQLRLLDRHVERLRQSNEEKDRSNSRVMRAAEDRERLERDVIEASKLRDRRIAIVDVLRKVPISFIYVYPRMANRPGEMSILLGKPAAGSDLARMLGGEQQLHLLVSGMSRQDIEDVLRSYPPLKGFSIRDLFELKRFKRYIKTRVDARIAAFDPEGLASNTDVTNVPLLPPP